jgi:hypothetical protein
LKQFSHFDRLLVTRSLDEYSVGFVSGLIGIPHYNALLEKLEFA